MKKLIIRIVISAVLSIAGKVLELNDQVQIGIFLAAYLIIGYDVLLRSFKNIRNGQIFDENFLMMIATVGAFLIGEYLESVAVMLFYQIGEAFNSYAVNRSRRSISALMELNPEFAVVLRNGEELKVDPYEVEIGEHILVRPGERVPLDGILVSGTGSLDTSAMTGEAIPKDVDTGDNVISGCISLNSLLEIEVTREFDDSTVGKILELVESATNRKAKAENFITKFARYYTPAVVLLAALLAVLPPLILKQPFSDWIYRALNFLVVSCPCALVISVPLSFFGGLGAASRVGVLVKGSNYLEAVAYLETVVFDKTGTLTSGIFRVTGIHPVSMTEQEFIKQMADAEQYSNHPVALSVRKAAQSLEALPESGDNGQSDIEELPGFGVRAGSVYVGNERLMKKLGISVSKITEIVTILHMAADGEYQGYVVISDEVKPTTEAALKNLRAAGVKQLVMLTGDKREVGEYVADHLGLDKAYTELLPADKVEQVEDLLKKKQDKRTLAFVGDGINDAPVLSIADIGIAMGGIGSDAAIEAADIVIMDDDLSKLPLTVRISRKTMAIVRQNIVFALGVKALVLILSAFGLASMWAAVFADVGVSVIAILNAMRCLTIKDS